MGSLATCIREAHPNMATRLPAPGDDLPQPNSDYAVSKWLAPISFDSTVRRRNFVAPTFACFQYMVRWRISSRLIPAVIKHGSEGGYPPLVNGAISGTSSTCRMPPRPTSTPHSICASLTMANRFNIGSGQQDDDCRGRARLCRNCRHQAAASFRARWRRENGTWRTGFPPEKTTEF